MASPELACVYASLILTDDNIEISSDKMEKLLNAAGVNVEKYWIELFAEYFKSHDINDLVKSTSFTEPATNASNNSITEETNKASIDDDEPNDREEPLNIDFDDIFA